METKKLYYDDVELKTMEAEVLSCEENSNTFNVTLNQTIFYPEGGGQNPDRGLLGEAKVLDVQEQDDVIIHTVDKPLTVGETVKGKVDYAWRFQMMQKHTAEHILVGLIHREFGFENVGFHMGKDYTTLDINGEVALEDLLTLEEEANKIIYKNKKVYGYYPKEEELKDIPYRGDESELIGDIRIVTIEDVDDCACCGLHCIRTGQVGLIKIVDAVKYKQGMRITMLCGLDALHDYKEKHEQIEALSVKLSSQPEKVYDAVTGLEEEIEKQKEEIVALSNDLLDYKAADIKEGAYACVFESIEGDNLRRFTNRIKEKVDIAFVFSKDNQKENMFRYCIASDKAEIDVREYVKKINEALNGRGGGSPEMAQGSLESSQEEIESFIETLI